MKEFQINPKNLEVLEDLNKLLTNGIEISEKLEKSKSNCRIEKGFVTELLIQGETIEQLPDSFSNLYKLRDLSIISALKTLPDSIGKLGNLESFDLDSRYMPNPPFFLDSLPDSIGKLKKLRNMSIGGTRLKTLPETIGNLKNLFWLCINGNEITSIPASIGKCRNLRYFLLEYNPKLRELPHSLENLDLKRIAFAKSNWRKFSTQTKEMLEKLRRQGCQVDKDGYDD